MSESSITSATAQDYSFVFPLKWDSTGAEVNFLTLLCLTSNLGPFQCYLSRLGGEDGHSTTASSLPRQLLIGLYLSSPPENHSTSSGVPLSSSHLTSLGDGEVAELLRLKIHQEKKVDHIPVATLSQRGGPGSEIVSRVREGLNRIGEACIASRYVDVGAFVMETLTQCRGVVDRNGGDEAAGVGHFVARVTAFLPQDTADSHPSQKEVHICKTPLYLLLALHLRFGKDESARKLLPWVPTSSALFPLIADEVMPSILLEEGVIDLTNANDAKLRSLKSPYLEQPLDTGQVTVIRAATVHASTLIKEKAGANPIDVDAFLRKRHRKQLKEAGKAVTPLTTIEQDRDEVGNW